MMQLWEFGYCLRLLRARMRFGHLSRAPLQFVHIEVRDTMARCEWIARAPDPWDDDLPDSAQAQRVSEQALEDALALRDLLFLALPRVQRAELKAFRRGGGGFPELIIEGVVSRSVAPPQRASSVAMRALLTGFRFWLDDGVLKALDTAQPVFEHAM